MGSKAIAAIMGTASLFSMMGVGKAVAQQSDQSTASTQLEEIVVTARRKEENLQKVPIAVTAFTSQKLEQNHIQDGLGLSRLTPSFQAYQVARDNDTYTIRGITSVQTASPGGPAVIPYFNDVPLLNASQSNGGVGLVGGGQTGLGPYTYYDLDSIQVLKGPQGTLFGASTVGGAILIYPKKPTNDFSGYLQTEFGNYGDEQVEAAINIPVIDDKLLVRLSGKHAVRDGFTTDVQAGDPNRDMDNRDFWAFRGSILARPTDDIENDFVATSSYSHTNGTGYIVDPLFFPTHLVASSPVAGLQIGGKQAYVAVTLGPATLPSLQSQAPLGGIFVFDAAFYTTAQIDSVFAQQQQLGIRATLGGLNDKPLSIGEFPLEKSWNYGFTDTFRWDLTDDITFKNIFGYEESKFLSREATLPLPGLFEYFVTPNDWSSELAVYTEEGQFQGKALGDNLSWQTGAFYSFPHGIARGNQEAYQGTGLTGSGTLILPPGAPRSRSISYALYAQGTYDMSGLSTALDGFKFTAGYRYSWDYRLLQTSGNSGPSPINGKTLCASPFLSLANNCFFSGSETFKEPSWTLSLDYQLTPETLVYVTGRHSYIPGNIEAPSVIAQSVYNPEKLTDVEIGVKSDFDLFGVKGRINLDAFHDEFDGVQIVNNITSQNTGAVIATVQNAAGATIQGVELEYLLVPVKDLTISGTYAYNIAKWDAFKALDVNGNSVSADPTFANTPLHKLSLTAAYRLPFVPDDWGDITALATYTWQTRAVVSQIAFRQPFTDQPHYGLLNLNAEWKNIAGRPFDATLFMTNVTDKVYIASAFSTLPNFGMASTVWSEPRMFGIQLRYRFGPGLDSGLPF